LSSELLTEICGRPLSNVMNDEVPGFLFDGCFRNRSITVIVAPPHRGKTMLMLDMAICLDMEIPLFGKFAPIKGQEVFFVGCDAPSWDYGLQSRKLCIGHGLDQDRRNLLGINGIWRRGMRITSNRIQDWLKRWRDETGASILFIDSHRATHGLDENNSTEMVKVWDVLCSMRDAGWSIIMSHHTSKPREAELEDVYAGRGSTLIADSADFIYTLAKRTRREIRVNVKCVKGRGSGGEDEPFDHFNMTNIPSTEIINGRPVNGIRLEV
jgi:RecA-family ATPase